jgi:hypothetical protein
VYEPPEQPFVALRWGSDRLPSDDSSGALICAPHNVRKSPLLKYHKHTALHPAAWPGATGLRTYWHDAGLVSILTRRTGRVLRCWRCPMRWTGHGSCRPRPHGRVRVARRSRDPRGPRGYARPRWSPDAHTPDARRGSAGMPGRRGQAGGGCHQPVTNGTRVTPSGRSSSAIRMRSA